MKFREYWMELRNKLEDGPPGEKFQLQMAPAHRKGAADYLKQGADFRLAAVMALLVPEVDSGNSSVILIERSVYDGVHSGQIALPGGKPDNDETLLDTAIRELEEETGIHGSMIEIVGTLSPLYIPPSKFLVHPFVAAIDHLPPFFPQEREVRRIFTMPVSGFNPLMAKTDTFKTSEGYHITAPYYDADGPLRIWGATAMILSELYALHQ